MSRRLRLLFTPAVLLAAAATVVVWSHRGASPSELGVLATGTLAVRIREHIALCAVSTALAVAVAVPAGIATTRPAGRRLAPPLLFLANVGQSIPTIAVLALAFSVTGIGFRTAVIGLWAYSLLPVLRNTVTGIAGVDPALREAGRGMGMTDRQLLLRVELPLAASVILAGIRVATVIGIGVATIAAAIGAGGLGVFIFRGVAMVDNRTILAGALPAAVLAVLADVGLGALERRLRGRR